MADDKEDLIIPENEPMPIIEGRPSRQRGEAHWLHLFLYILTSLIFAFFLVLGGRWVYHKTHHNQPVTPTQTATKTTQPSTAKQAPAAPQTKPSTGTSSNNTASPSKNSTNTSSPSASPNQVAQLPNNGPGNVLAIFLGVSAITAMLHYTLSLQNSKQEF